MEENREYISFKWELLKSKARDEANKMRHNEHAMCYAIMSTLGDMSKGKIGNWRDNLEELQSMVINTINRWDIRMCRDLIDAFPSIIPKKYFDKVPSVEMDEKGNWVLIYRRGECYE